MTIMPFLSAAGCRRSAGSIRMALLAVMILVTAEGATGGAVEADGMSTAPTFAPDGSAVAFVSDATNLVDGDTNGASDVFLRDLATGRIERVSVGTSGAEAQEASLAVAFAGTPDVMLFVTLARLDPADRNDHFDLYLRDRARGVTRRLVASHDGDDPDGDVYRVEASRDGRYAVFGSAATNLVAADRNGKDDVFRVELATGRVERMSVRDRGGESDGHSVNPAISPDGTRVAFLSDAVALVDGDTNQAQDVFLRDTRTGRTRRISVASDGVGADWHSGNPAFGTDDLVVFDSGATNLVPGDRNDAWDVFVHDLRDGTTARVSSRPDGTDVDDGSASGSLSADGRRVAFTSMASNLDPADGDPVEDLFVRPLDGGPPVRVSRPLARSMNDGVSGVPEFSPDGDRVAFASESSELVPGDTNGVMDVFLVDLTSGMVSRLSQREPTP
jgi:Tol biopolymer transport system component